MNKMYAYYLQVSDDEVGEVLRKLKRRRGPGCDYIPPLFYLACADGGAGFFFANRICLYFSLSVWFYSCHWDLSCYVYFTDSRKIIWIHYDFKTVVSFWVYHSEGAAWFLYITFSITNFVDFVVGCMSNISEVHSIYIYFSKAFVKVNHSVLVQKLAAYIGADTLFTWFIFYLLERTLQIKIRSP